MDLPVLLEWAVPTVQLVQPVSGFTPRPTAGLWRILQEATLEATRRGHTHVGAEHLLYVVASTPDTFGRSILEHLSDAEAIATGVDELMRSDQYANAGSNEARGKDGELVGHVVVGPDGKPRLEPL